MKITGRASAPANVPVSLPPKCPEPTPQLDLPASKSSHRRRTRLRRTSAPAGKRGSRPETPLLKWKIEEKEKKLVSVEEEFLEPRRQRDNLSARKLAAVLWRLSLPEVVGEGTGVLGRGEEDEQVVSHVRLPSVGHHNGKLYASEAKDLVHSPSSVCSTRNGFCKVEPSFKFSNCAMEGATKWNPVTLKSPGEAYEVYSDRKVGAASVISSLEADLEQAQVRIQELESEQHHSKKKLEHFLKKLGEEKAAWRRREHEKIRAFIDDIKSDLNRERKSRQRLSIVNSKLVDDLAEAKSLAKQILQDCEKERKTRKLIEEVCDELAKEIGEDKAEVEEIKKESIKLRDAVEDERKMLQMAEVWREERVQMKLVDAKVALEEKYSEMNKLVAGLENFLKNNSSNPDLLEAELLRQAAASVNIQEITDFHYEPPDDDIFSVLEEMNNLGENNACGSSSCSPVTSRSSPEASKEGGGITKHSVGVMKHNSSNRSEDESGWETVSNLGSSFSPASMTEMSDGGYSSGKPNKASSIARLWRRDNDCNNKVVVSMEDDGGVMLSPDGGNPHIRRAMKKGCMEWPRGSQKNSLKTKLLQARMDTQKIQLRQVLQQKMY